MSATMKLNNINIIASWVFDSPYVNECTLCSKHLVALSPQSLNNYNTTKKHIIQNEYTVKGSCGHMFHKTCMDSLVNNGSNICPMCRTPWKTANIMSTSSLPSTNNIHVMKNDKTK